ncbi:MAG: C5 methylase (MAV1virus-like) protein [Mycoplasmoidaceae bacterium]
MKKKYVVWDLFGGGQNSVYNAMKKNEKFDIYTFDVTEPTREKHFKVDLAQDNIVEVMNSLNVPKPDIILSSTLCQSFSVVLNMKGGGTCFWKYNKNKNKLILRSKKEFEELKSGFTKNLKADVQLFIAKLGKKCIDNTIELISHFNPKYWYIENPRSSLIWKYIILNRKDFYDPNKFFFNETSYGKYGYLITKPTYFLSNVKMDLLKGKIPPPYTIKEINGTKYYVLNEDSSVKVLHSLDSRMIGLASINKIIKARSAKSGMGGMDFVMKQKGNNIYQKNKKVNEQLSESGASSAIPPSLINTIFSYFD